MTKPPFRGIRIPSAETTFPERLGQLRHRWRLIIRVAAASSGAFWFASAILGHQQAFFAPIAAVIILMAGSGLRTRMLGELVVGVAVGVLSAELLIMVIGRGPVAVAVVASLTIMVATLAGVKGFGLTQAVNSAVLLGAVIPPEGATDPALSRFLDALIGGVFALVMIALVPRNTVRDIDQRVQELLRGLAAILSQLGAAMKCDDAKVAGEVLERARGMQSLVDDVEATATNVTEVARLAPMRWRQRAEVLRYVASTAHLDNAVRDTRVLARRTAAMLRHDERVPGGIIEAMGLLARAVDVFSDELAALEDFDEARGLLVEAVASAMGAMNEVVTVNKAAVASQIRSIAADLLLASGVPNKELDEMLDVG